jgi:hypothetical protein
MWGFQNERVIPAKAGTYEHLTRRTGGGLRSWVPAFAGMTLVGLLLTACQRAEPPAANQAAAAPKAVLPQPEGDVGRAERLVRERLGNPADIAFANPRQSASEGATIICGEYRHAGATHRYIVVGGEDVFVEPQMERGEMDRAFTEFCGGGRA